MVFPHLTAGDHVFCDQYVHWLAVNCCSMHAASLARVLSAHVELAKNGIVH